MKKYALIMLLIGQLAFATKIYSQNIAINGTGSLPDTSAMLDVSSTIKGFLAPRMTTTQQNAIPLPANGLLIYNTTDNGFKVNTGTTTKPLWTSLSAGGANTVTTNLLSSSANTMTSTTNGVAATAPIVNSNALSLSGHNLVSTINGLSSTGLALPFLSSMNGLSGTAQTFSTGTSGSDFGISSSATTHTFNLPTASAANRGALSAADWTIFNGKQAALVSGTSIKTINSGSLLGSGNISLEPVLTAPNTIKRYLNGYKQFVAFLTDSIAEGTLNLYYTNTRSRAAISLTTTGTSGAATYNSSTGVLNIPAYITGGTVTSVGLTSSDITVGGTSPITGNGSYTLALPTVNSNVGTYTNATITVNAKGLITAASSGSSSTNASGWGLTGNSGTGSSNYIGTSDGQPLVFKVSGTQAGYLGLTSSYATSFGIGSAASFKSTAIGSGATANSGNEAVALGFNSIAAGYRSIAIGSAAQAHATNDAIAIGTGSSANSYQGIAIGAGASTTSNNSALAIGVGAIATAYQSTAIGSGSSATAQNATAIGNGASVSNDNYISIGNTSVTAIRGQVNFTTYSDGRFKRNIHNDVPGLDFIMKLRPVTYTWDIHKFNEHSQGDEIKTIPAKYTPQNDKEEAAILKKESIIYTGFIAQEVEKAAQTCKFNFSGVLKPVNDKDAYSLSYAEFVVPLVKAAQELHEENEILNNRIDAQQKIIDQLLEDVKQLKDTHK